MSEYFFVEKPFLDQLRAMGWQVIDQGHGAIPTDPAQSLRTSFRQLVLPEVFRTALLTLNTLADGTPWLAERQVTQLYDELTGQPGALIEANEAVQELLVKAVVDRNERTGEDYPTVKLIDFEHPERNLFHAINQFRIDTPGRVKDFIIPDVVLFVNGIPLVTVECKEANAFTANPLYEAYVQIRRYSDQREETRLAGLSEGEPRLFHFNQFNVITSGDAARFGSPTATEDFFYPWRDIYPPQYQRFTPPLGEAREQEVLIQGLLPPATLLDIVRSFVVFRTVDGRRVKVVCRYPQYRAVGKIVDRLRSKETPAERSGVVWHTQGSGKSLTMVFAVRKLRRCDDLRDYKVVLVNDRTDLEQQLGETALLSGEKPVVIERIEDLHKLATPSSNLNLVMVHKFQDATDDDDLPGYLAAHLPPVGGPALAPEASASRRQFIYPRLDQRPTRRARAAEPLAEYRIFGEINPSDRIILMIDEAHRSQGGQLSQNLFDAFPNATRIAFTGTPLIADRFAAKNLLTRQRFGGYIDTYTLHDSVADGATVKILYVGKTAHTALADPLIFERRFEDLCRSLSDEQVARLKAKYGTSGDILEAERRIEAIAQDLVNHYVDHILPDGFKAQVVASTQLAAVRYQRAIEQALARRLAVERGRPEADPDAIAAIAFLKVRTVISGQGTNELAEITAVRKQARDDDAVENFKRAFDVGDPAQGKAPKPLTGIAFLVVCDMLLTGFDAPIEQVMYVDKQVREHNLLQTIARVNRTAAGKNCGYIVDYIGLTHHLQEAFAIYAEESQRDLAQSLASIDSELPILEQRYQRLLNLFRDHGLREIDDFVQQRIDQPAQEYAILQRILDLLEDIKLRADFEVYFKKFLQSLNIILPDRRANPYRVPARRFGYLLAQIKQRTKDSSLTLAGVGEKVRKLINEYLVSQGIDPAIPPIEITDPSFALHLAGQSDPKAKASEMEHAIRKHCKVHLNEDPVFYGRLSDKLEALIRQYEDNWVQLAVELEQLTDETQAGRRSAGEALPPGVAPFRDLIVQVAFAADAPPEQAAAIERLAQQVVEVLRGRIGIVDFWQKPYEVNQLKGDLSDLFLLSGVPELEAQADHLVAEVAALAKHRQERLLAGV